MKVLKHKNFAIAMLLCIGLSMLVGGIVALSSDGASRPQPSRQIDLEDIYWQLADIEDRVQKVERDLIDMKHQLERIEGRPTYPYYDLQQIKKDLEYIKWQLSLRR